MDSGGTKIKWVFRTLWRIGPGRGCLISRFRKTVIHPSRSRYPSIPISTNSISQYPYFTDWYPNIPVSVTNIHPILVISQYPNLVYLGPKNRYRKTPNKRPLPIHAPLYTLDPIIGYIFAFLAISRLKMVRFSFCKKLLEGEICALYDPNTCKRPLVFIGGFTVCTVPFTFSVVRSNP